MRRRAAWIALAAAAMASGCGGDGSGDGDAASAACSPNDEIRKGLEASCAGCHQQGDKGYFASLVAFEDLLVYDTRLVKPGDPDGSRLVKLLEGTADGTPSQMPIAGEPYAALAGKGAAPLSMDRVREWIRTLAPRTNRTTPSRSAVTVRRIGAEQIREALYAQLGLTQDDFFIQATSYGAPSVASKGEDNYPLYSPDDAPGLFYAEPGTRHIAMGGVASIQGKKREQDITPSFVQALVPMSQRWCKMAIAKGQKEPLFPHVDPAASSAEASADIKKNIGAMHLHFLGELGDDAAIATVFDEVFVPLESTSDAKTAWAGVCSYFIRHPRWVFY